MESLNTASEILSQLMQLTDGMVLICQDVNVLKCWGTTQCNPSLEANDNGMLDKKADDSPQLTSWPFENNNSGSSSKNTASNDQTGRGDGPEESPVRWHPDKGQYSYQKSCMKKCLNDTFTKEMSGANRRSLTSQYMLPQNDLTIAPFPDAMMGSECSKLSKSMNCKFAV